MASWSATRLRAADFGRIQIGIRRCWRRPIVGILERIEALSAESAGRLVHIEIPIGQLTPAATGRLRIGLVVIDERDTDGARRPLPGLPDAPPVAVDCHRDALVRRKADEPIGVRQLRTVIRAPANPLEAALHFERAQNPEHGVPTRRERGGDFGNWNLSDPGIRVSQEGEMKQHALLLQRTEPD